jgi:hypothetical protein
VRAWTIVVAAAAALGGACARGTGAQRAEEAAPTSIAARVDPEPPEAADRLLDTMTRRGDHEAARLEVVEEPDFARVFDRRTDGPVVDATEDPPEQWSDGSRLVFPAGVHTWHTRRCFDGRRFPNDLLVEGAGMDETLIVLSAPISATGRFRGLTFRDATLFCEPAVARLSGAGLVRLERVRVIGLDGAGRQGCLVLGNGVGLHAVESRFEAGFGSLPGALWFLYSNYAGGGGPGKGGWPLLARFDRCLFRGPFEKPDGKPVSPYLGAAPSAGLFVECRFEGATAADRMAFEGRHERPASWRPAAERFVDCSIVDAGDAPERRRRDVSELNPAWRLPTT